jgi:hypothetical protein
MGEMRFDLRPPERVHDAMIRRAFLAGLDRVPWRAKTVRIDAPEHVQVRFERRVSEAASLCIPWPIPGYGYLAISTGTLTERDDPYAIPFELARGKIGQVRNQVGEWKTVGLDVPAKLLVLLAEATQRLGHAVSLGRQSPQAVVAAERALQLAVESSHLLTGAFAEQATAFRRATAPHLPTLLGASAGVAPPTDAEGESFAGAFNAACVPIVWRAVETAEGAYVWDAVDRRIAWCRDRGLTIGAGPLVQLDPQSIPDWLYLCEGDVEAAIDMATEFVRTTVSRYAGTVDFWMVASRINTGELLALSEADKLHLAATLVETARAADRRADILIAVDQPWGEYLMLCDNELPPIHFADALLRANLGLTGLAIEVNVGFAHGATSPRDPLDFSRMIDCWSGLGTPLYVSVAVPSQGESDVPTQGATSPLPDMWSPVAQQAWVLRNVPPLLARSAVRAVLWNQLRDAEPHLLSHAGLFDADGQAKPALRSLAALRKTHLR